MRIGPIVAAIVLMSVTGCGVESSVIRSQAISYDDVIEDTTDKLLLLNILRAKDKAPLHFDEIPSIHESIQASASLQASWPFGPRLANANTSPRNMVQPTLGVQVSPTFEVDHLDTQDFVTGIASPIDPKFVKYWLDRGLDRRLVLLLFFSAVTITETETIGGKENTTVIRLMNSPREASDTLPEQEQVFGGGHVDEPSRCDATSEFQHYLRFIDALRAFSPQYSKKPRLLVENLSGDAAADTSSAKGEGNTSRKGSGDANGDATQKAKLPNWQAIASLDAEKFQWKRNQDGTFNVYAIPAEATTTLCPINADADSPDSATECIQVGIPKNPDELTAPKQYPAPAPTVARRSPPSNYCATFNRLIDGHGTRDEARPNAKIEIRFEIRSVGEMIQFLGDLLEYQQKLAPVLRSVSPEQLRLHNPLTFGYCDAREHRSAGCNDAFFNLPSDTCNSRFAVAYRGRIYAVPNFDPPEEGACQTDEANRRSAGTKDHTLEVLSVVHQMVDLQKSAQDIRETPYVQVLP